MTGEELTIRARRGDIRCGCPDTVKLYAYLTRNGSQWCPDGKLKFKELAGYDRYLPSESFLDIDINEAQKLMDDLWDCGLRPSEGTGSAGALAATQKHLNDLRKIAFNKLGIKE